MMWTIFYRKEYDMPLSQSEYAAAVAKLRHILIRTARHLLRCTYDDAEDLVSEVVLIGLSRLHEWTAETCVDGLRSWLTAILHRTIQHDLRNRARHVEIVSSSEPYALEATRHLDRSAAFIESLRSLPSRRRALVLDWLDGYSQDSIARRNRLHRNTVAIRLEDAFASLRAQFPDRETLEYAISLFVLCSRATVYRKPDGCRRLWAQRHPKEPKFRPRLLTRDRNG
jgi:RNA polymerase sigma factor (sigma-70 family)